MSVRGRVPRPSTRPPPANAAVGRTQLERGATVRPVCACVCAREASDALSWLGGRFGTRTCFLAARSRCSLIDVRSSAWRSSSPPASASISPSVMTFATLLYCSQRSDVCCTALEAVVSASSDLMRDAAESPEPKNATSELSDFESSFASMASLRARSSRSESASAVAAAAAASEFAAAADVSRASADEAECARSKSPDSCTVCFCSALMSRRASRAVAFLSFTAASRSAIALAAEPSEAFARSCSIATSADCF